MKNIVQFAHASTYRYGSNYLNVDYFKSDSKDPALARYSLGGLPSSPSVGDSAPTVGISKCAREKDK